MKLRYRMTITISEDAPTGTALLFAFAEAIKSVSFIAALGQGKRLSIDADSESQLLDGDWTSGAHVTIARLKDDEKL
jgi:hypothetical protein